MRPLLAAAVFLAAGAATAPPAWAAPPNDIIWDTPAPKNAPQNTPQNTPKSGDVSQDSTTPPGAGQPDKNGIIWDTPASANPAPAAQAAKPDANGIIWNAPPVKPASAPAASVPASAPKGPVLSPPGGRVAQTPPTAEGPCREFQTTIVIDGKSEPAHGTACQQADGTWRVVNK